MQRIILADVIPILEAVEQFRTGIGETGWDATNEIESFLATARGLDVPVLYTRLVPSSYDDLSIVDPVAPEPGDNVIDKTYASAFYGTDLRTRLVRGAWTRS